MTKALPESSNTIDSGFTLVELLTTFAIVALLGLAVVSYGGAARSDPSMREVSRSVARLASQAALKAVTTGNARHLIVSPQQKRIFVQGNEEQLLVPADIAISVTAAAELLREDGAAQIDFYPDGSSSGGEIRLADTAGRARSVQVHWLTGAITSSIAE